VHDYLASTVVISYSLKCIYLSVYLLMLDLVALLSFGKKEVHLMMAMYGKNM
jgi:hypothetical protein